MITLIKITHWIATIQDKSGSSKLDPSSADQLQGKVLDLLIKFSRAVFSHEARHLKNLWGSTVRSGFFATTGLASILHRWVAVSQVALALIWEGF